ncbi:hypothetical protein BJ138DRAFT_948055 [Hygrophoropsis aurantiaca]|uniref:Uncharacterized protein n=1 Tax=Hygrophoropsis aurantiaca TaxID=72124 RepID=A0ACB8AD86_9AGAM|nr:hypothetical protein BJ138DRAFT_948055 [Hygrophoropsis aurantiaca]
MYSSSTVVLALIFAAFNSSVGALPTNGIEARNDRDSAYTGAGGQALGGSVMGAAKPACSIEEGSLLGGLGCLDDLNLLNFDSNNAGNGGLATSGASFGGMTGGSGSSKKKGSMATVSSVPAGNAFSGVGGGSSGGSTSGVGEGLLDLFSGKHASSLLGSMTEREQQAMAAMPEKVQADQASED